MIEEVAKKTQGILSNKWFLIGGAGVLVLGGITLAMRSRSGASEVSEEVIEEEDGYPEQKVDAGALQGYLSDQLESYKEYMDNQQASWKDQYDNLNAHWEEQMEKQKEFDEQQTNLLKDMIDQLNDKIANTGGSQPPVSNPYVPPVVTPPPVNPPKPDPEPVKPPITNYPWKPPKDDIIKPPKPEPDKPPKPDYPTPDNTPKPTCIKEGFIGKARWIGNGWTCDYKPDPNYNPPTTGTGSGGKGGKKDDNDRGNDKDDYEQGDTGLGGGGTYRTDDEPYSGGDGNVGGRPIFG